MIPVRVCKHTTGQEATAEFYPGIEIIPPVWIEPSSIYFMAKVHDQDCTIIVTTSGRQISVMGTPKDIACKAIGGPTCEPSNN